MGAVKSLQDFNGTAKEGADLQLPSLMTIYFAGLDHAEHLSSENPEQARLEYLKHIDDLIAKFIAGDRAIMRTSPCQTGIRGHGSRPDSVARITE